MIKDEFEEIIQQCCTALPNFVTQANWDFLELDEPNSIDVKVSIIQNTIIDGMEFRILISGTSRTQDSPECIQSAIEALNEQLLSKLFNGDLL